MKREKRLTKREIATMIDDFDRDRGIMGRMPVHVWVDAFTRAELVDTYNFRIEGMGLEPIQ